VWLPLKCRELHKFKLRAWEGFQAPSELRSKTILVKKKKKEGKKIARKKVKPISAAKHLYSFPYIIIIIMRLYLVKIEVKKMVNNGKKENGSFIELATKPQIELIKSL
jgi:hypothetical protein